MSRILPVAEGTTLILRPADGPDDGSVLDEVHLDLDGEVTDEELDQLIRDLDTDTFRAYRSRSAIHWGATHSTDVIELQFGGIVEQALWLTIGAALDRILTKRSQPGPTPDRDRAESSARVRLASKFNVRAVDLRLVKESEDTHARTWTFRFQDGSYFYETVVRTTPKGYIFTTGVTRELREPNAVG